MTGTDPKPPRMGDLTELLGETVRIWDAQHMGVFVEGEVIACTDSPTIIVRTSCECGREKHVSHIASLPIDIRTWVPR